MVPRVLNYALLTPFYTRIFPIESGEYGVVTEIYAYMAILLIILTYGMETTFFRFTTSKEYNKEKVYNSSLISLFTTSLLFIVLIIVFADRTANLLEYSGHREYIIMFSMIVAIDAFTAIPFARLRIENQVFKFSAIKLINVLVIIIVAFSFLYFIPRHIDNNPETFFKKIYSDKIGVGYVFIANLCGSIISLILLLPHIIKVRLKVDIKVLKKMFVYAFPLLIAGLGGVLNESFDKVAMKFLLPDRSTSMSQLAVYGANFKIAVLMSLFIQMFRYAFEPFFFSRSNEKNAREIYVQIMNYFVIFCLFIFIGISLNLEIFKYLIDKDYWTALNVVPIILMSFVFLGIFVNLSVWYKLNDITKYGAILTFAGAIITIFINIKFIPVYGYTASAWGHFTAYLVMVILSYILGKKFYPVSYNILKITSYFLLAVGIFAAGTFMEFQLKIISFIVNNIMIGIFVAVVYFKEIKGKIL